MNENKIEVSIQKSVIFSVIQSIEGVQSNNYFYYSFHFFFNQRLLCKLLCNWLVNFYIFNSL